MICPKCSYRRFTGPFLSVGQPYSNGQRGPDLNAYRCAKCGFTRHEPCDDDKTEYQMLAALAARS